MFIARNSQFIQSSLRRTVAQISTPKIQTFNMSTAATIQKKLTEKFNPIHLDVINESKNHNVPIGSETHFKVIVVSDWFNEKPLLSRHRSVNECLSEELANGVHALSIVAKTREQWEKDSSVGKSPPCLGGSKREDMAYGYSYGSGASSEYDTNSYLSGFDTPMVGGGDSSGGKREPGGKFQLSGGRKYMIRARGLPWSVTDDEIAEFFEPEIVMTTKDQIHRYDFNGRFSGEIFIELYSKDEVQSAVKKNRNSMGRRYIEVFESSADDYQKALEKAGLADTGTEPILKLRGLPFHVREDEIVSFLEGCEVKRDGIHFVPDRHGRGTCNGEAFVELVDAKTLERALSKNKATIGSRWIEVFKSTRGEMESIMYPDMMGGPGGYGGDPYFYGGGAGGMYAEDVAFGPGGGRRGGGGGGGIPPPFRHGHAPYDRPMHPPPIGGYGPSPYGGRTFRIRMRGLPFESSRQDVIQFFHPAEVLFLEFVRDSNGKIQDCMVEFGNQRDFALAMSRHRQHMGRRYVELIPCDDDYYEAGPPGGGGGGAFGGRGVGPPGGGHGGPPPLEHGMFRLKMRGLPFECSTSEIYRFFEGLHVSAVEMMRDNSGKVQEAFVSFATESEFNSAMERNRQNIRHRYIELFAANEAPGPIRRGAGSGPGGQGARGRGGGRGGSNSGGSASGDGGGSESRNGRKVDYGGFQ